MRCEKHNIEMNETCDTSSCGVCFGEALEQEKQQNKTFEPLPDMSMVGGHQIPELVPK